MWHTLMRVMHLAGYHRQENPAYSAQVIIYPDSQEMAAHIALKIVNKSSQTTEHYISFAPESWEGLNTLLDTTKRDAIFLTEADDENIQKLRAHFSYFFRDNEQFKNFIQANSLDEFSAAEKNSIRDNKLKEISNVKVSKLYRLLITNHIIAEENFTQEVRKPRIIQFDTLDMEKIINAIGNLPKEDMQWVYRSGTASALSLGRSNTANCGSLVVNLLEQGGLNQLAPSMADQTTIIGILGAALYTLCTYQNQPWPTLLLTVTSTILGSRALGGAWNGLKTAKGMIEVAQSYNINNPILNGFLRVAGSVSHAAFSLVSHSKTTSFMALPQTVEQELKFAEQTEKILKANF